MTTDELSGGIQTSAWHCRLGDLPISLRTEIRDLYAVRPQWNIVALLFPTIWILSVAAMEKWPNFPVRIAGILIIGVSIQAMAIIMHEALHANLFRQPVWDRWVGFVMAVPAFFSFTAYKVAHLNHHRYTRTDKDQDELPNMCRNRQQYVALYYGWFVVGTFLYFFIVPWKALRIARSRDRSRICTEYLLMFLMYGFVVWLAIRSGHSMSLFWYWLFPAQVAIFLSNVRGLAEHLGTEGSGDAISRTRTVTSNKLVSFLMLNLNYHLEHHLFPAVPWYSLPKAHQMLKPIYQNRQPDVRRSYLLYALESLRTGPKEMLE
jgi:fatty acid desaturase